MIHITELTAAAGDFLRSNNLSIIPSIKRGLRPLVICVDKNKLSWSHIQRSIYMRQRTARTTQSTQRAEQRNERIFGDQTLSSIDIKIHKLLSKDRHKFIRQRNYIHLYHIYYSHILHFRTFLKCHMPCSRRYLADDQNPSSLKSLQTYGRLTGVAGQLTVFINIERALGSSA